MNAKQIVDEAVAILVSLNRPELLAVKVKASNAMKVVAGMARRKFMGDSVGNVRVEYEMRLSVPIYSRPENEHAFRNTVLHEAAHILAGIEHGHNAHWQFVARSIGCTAQRCHTLNVGERRTQAGGIVLQCPRCKSTTRVGPTRAARFHENPNRYRCNRCKIVVELLP
jgi:predicted SprT family Zn-dependent metalloprotease